MAQWLRALTVLPEDLGLVPSTCIEVTTISNSGSRIPDAIFWPLKAQDENLHTCTCRQNTYTHKLIFLSGYKAMKTSWLCVFETESHIVVQTDLELNM